MKLSSPCGDKLQSVTKDDITGLGSYRPLAGISCNSSRRLNSSCSALSSPCGDKLQ